MNFAFLPSGLAVYGNSIFNNVFDMSYHEFVLIENTKRIVIIGLWVLIAYLMC